MADELNSTYYHRIEFSRTGGVTWEPTNWHKWFDDTSLESAERFAQDLHNHSDGQWFRVVTHYSRKSVSTTFYGKE